MSKRDIAALTFTIAGIYALIEGLGSLTNLSYLFWAILAGGSIQGITLGGVMAVSAPFVLLTILGSALILGRRQLAARMFTDDISAVSAEERFLAIPALAYSIVGIVLIALSVSGLSAFFNLMAMGVSPGFWQTLSNIVPTLVQFALGLGLFFGSHGLVRLWSRLRYAGLRRQLGLCVRCGYDLTGNVSGVCPECGTPIEPTEAK